MSSDLVVNTLKESIAFIVVAALWGCTNPLIEKYSTGNGFFADVRSGNWKVVLFFLLNQCGSLAQATLLSSKELISLPVCNALTCLFTALTALWMGKKYRSVIVIFQGCLCILAGTALILYKPDSRIKDSVPPPDHNNDL